MSLISKKEKLSAWEKVLLARKIERLKPMDYVRSLFQDITILSGDRLGEEDPSLICGIASFHGQAISFFAFAKAHSTEENIKGNFGMASPAAYRKAKRLMLQAEKFKRPIICFVDTPGAYPGIEAEEKGQGEAIANLLMTMQFLKTPSISIVTGEGGSGGALCLSMADRLYMQEYAIYSILSPEGFATILWKDKKKAREAADMMRIQAEDLKTFGLIDAVLPEEGLEENEIIATVEKTIAESLEELSEIPIEELLDKRVSRIREIGSFTA